MLELGLLACRCYEHMPGFTWDTCSVSGPFMQLWRQLVLNQWRWVKRAKDLGTL